MGWAGLGWDGLGKLSNIEVRVIYEKAIWNIQYWTLMSELLKLKVERRKWKLLDMAT